jgi:hypothetical protein
MSITLLEFGNVLVLLILLAAISVFIAAVNEILLGLGHIALSLDKQGAPKILKSNWTLDFITKVFKAKGYKWYVKRGEKYLDFSDKVFCNRIFVGCRFFCEETAKSEAYKYGGEVVVADQSYFARALWLLGYCFLADILILWLEAHFLSAVWSLSVVGTILSLRFITGKIWGHNNRITVLEEK